MTKQLFAVLAVIGGLVAAPAFAEPSLRDSVTVSTNLVTAGDLIVMTGEKAAIPLFRAPDIGRSGIISAERVQLAAARHGIAVDALPGQQITVWRASRMVTADDVKAAFKTALKTASEPSDDVTLTVDRPNFDAAVHLDPMVSEPISIEALDIDPRSGRIEAIALLRDNAGQVKFRERIIARMTKTIEVPVLARDLSRGTILAPDDVAFEHRTVPPATTDPTPLAALVGKSLKRRIPAGTELTTDHVMAPNYVSRNDTVTMIYQTGRLVLSTRGRALSDGTAGALVPVLNMQSKRIIEAEVSEPGVVVVRPKDATIAVAVAAPPAMAAAPAPTPAPEPALSARPVRTSTITITE